ncbi:MAG: radical SAM protein [Dehalococcoidales bacterium]|nr:radical SAM protein [Dehalococcoidales bacterium]
MNGSLAYGPVPSRRLGHSLGINNIPPKVCSYSCVYCQLGTIGKRQVVRTGFYDPEEISTSAGVLLQEAGKRDEKIDYLSFVPDGEPTLDANLDKEIDLLRQFGKKIAVITNGSLIWHEDVRRDLLKVDWVSFKIDALSSSVWQRIDRPHRVLDIRKILDGMLAFRDSFTGVLNTETMLVSGFNDNAEETETIADFISKLSPAMSYLSVPTRPPAVKTITAAGEKSINTAYQIFNERSLKVECLTGYEGNDFAFTGSASDNLLNITAVHPMREEAVAELLRKAGNGWDTVEGLIKDGKIVETEYLGKKFYIRKLHPFTGPVGR